MVDEEEVRERWKEHFEELYGPVSERVSQHTYCTKVPVDGELEIMQEEVRSGVRRGISLMSMVGKVFARVLNERVKVLTGEKVMDEQGGSGLEEVAWIRFLWSDRLWKRQ